MSEYERLVWSPPTHAVITQGDALVQLWEREAPVEAFHAILRHLEERKRASPDRPLWMLAVSSEHAGMPEAEARRVSARFPEFFTEFALVIEGTGFQASAARAVMSSMSMMSTKRAKAHITATVPEACRVIASLSQGTLDAASLVRAIGEAREVLRR